MNSVDMWGGIPDEAWISADTTIQQKTSSYYSQKIYTASPTPNTEIRQYRHHHQENRTPPIRNPYKKTVLIQI